MGVVGGFSLAIAFLLHVFYVSFITFDGFVIMCFRSYTRFDLNVVS